MFNLNTCKEIYPILLIKTIGKRSFEAMSKVINETGRKIKKWLLSPDEYFEQMVIVAMCMFAKKKKLYLLIDDTLIKKMFSTQMVGSGRFYDSKIGRKILSYKTLCAAISDGHYTIPFNACFLYDKELLEGHIQSKFEILKDMILKAISTFSDKEIIVVMDGAFATKELLQWAIDNNIKVEVRMHSNRSVKYNGKAVAIKKIKTLIPKGRKYARTIQALWYGMLLDITAHRRIDKHGRESIVYQAATYRAKPADHIKAYTGRWPIEKCFRTCKQSLGLQDCYSTDMDVQLSHVASVFYAYALIQMEMKRRRLDTPEDTIRMLKSKNVHFLIRRLYLPDEIFEVAQA